MKKTLNIEEIQKYETQIVNVNEPVYIPIITGVA